MKENESIIKHIHNFKSYLQQLLATRLTIQDDEAILTSMRSLPPSYTSFIHSYKRQQGITLQSLIIDLIQEKTLIKDIGSTLENASIFFFERKLLIMARIFILIRTLISSLIQKVKGALNLMKKMI